MTMTAVLENFLAWLARADLFAAALDAAVKGSRSTLLRRLK
jgi:hypothetical protein